jgi:hypothetical protein
MGQIAIAISQLEAQSSGKLPFQTLVNPSAIVLRSCKEVEIAAKAAPASSKQENEKNVVGTRTFPMTMTYLNVSFRLFLIINRYLLFLRLWQNLENMSKIKIYMRLFVDVR